MKKELVDGKEDLSLEGMRKGATPLSARKGVMLHRTMKRRQVERSSSCRVGGSVCEEETRCGKPLGEAGFNRGNHIDRCESTIVLPAEEYVEYFGKKDGRSLLNHLFVVAV